MNEEAFYISYQAFDERGYALDYRCCIHDCPFVMDRGTVRKIVTRLRKEGKGSIRVYRSI